jgi:hypothetical protein
LPGQPAWKPLLKTLSWANKGLAEAFAWYYLIRREKSRIGAAVFRKYTATELDKRLRDHFVLVAKVEITPMFGLRVEPKQKEVLDPRGFTYLAHFRWVRDRTTFKIGLDRLDDSLIRIFLMWTGCRRHELVYSPPKDMKEKIKKEYDGESDAYTDANNTDKYIQRRPKEC